MPSKPEPIEGVAAVLPRRDFLKLGVGFSVALRWKLSDYSNSWKILLAVSQKLVEVTNYTSARVLTGCLMVLKMQELG